MKHQKGFFGYVIVYWAMLLLMRIITAILFLLTRMIGVQPPILMMIMGLSILILPAFIAAGRFLFVEERLPVRRENVLMSLCGFALPGIFDHGIYDDRYYFSQRLGSCDIYCRWRRGRPDTVLFVINPEFRCSGPFSLRSRSGRSRCRARLIIRNRL